MIDSARHRPTNHRLVIDRECLMAKRLCGSVLSGWGVLAVGTLWLCLFAPSSAEAAIGRTAGSFDVSANGAATYTIPIFTPPGPRGVQPAIALNYNSNSDVGYL